MGHYDPTNPIFLAYNLMSQHDPTNSHISNNLLK